MNKKIRKCLFLIFFDDIYSHLYLVHLISIITRRIIALSSREARLSSLGYHCFIFFHSLFVLRNKTIFLVFSFVVGSRKRTRTRTKFSSYFQKVIFCWVTKVLNGKNVKKYVIHLLLQVHKNKKAWRKKKSILSFFILWQFLRRNLKRRLLQNFSILKATLKYECAYKPWIRTKIENSLIPKKVFK